MMSCVVSVALLEREVTGVLVTDRHHGRGGTTFTVTHVHLSDDIASRVEVKVFEICDVLFYVTAMYKRDLHVSFDVN